MKMILQVAWAIGFALLTGCGQREAPAEPNKFDAKAIASEADRGNLEPLKELNEACTAEVKREGKRMSACKAQDDVGSLMKPLHIRF
jgi:hypothetical protein